MVWGKVRRNRPALEPSLHRCRSAVQPPNKDGPNSGEFDGGSEFCMVGKRSVILGSAPLDEAQELFDHSVTVDPLNIVKLEPLETAAPPKSNGVG